MDAWHDFFLSQAATAGVLTGLVFVGVSINLERIVSDPESGLTGRAAEALILLVAVLMASCVLLIPGQGARLFGLEVLTIGLAAWAWAVAILHRRRESWRTMGSDLRMAFVLRVALAQLGTVPFLVSGILMLAGELVGLYWLAAGMIFSVLAALFGAWVLLIEIHR